MFIYKITNKINGKIYVGQVYNRSIMDRFKRHCTDAKPDCKMAIDRAIYKYGVDNFTVEQIDKADNLNELNKKEIYWIEKLKSNDSKYGYNLTRGGEGGNTYVNKTPEEMKSIRKKLSDSKKGSQNGKSVKVKAYNICTKEELHFDTMISLQSHFNLKGKGTLKNHCDHKAKYYWNKCWVFAYESNDYDKLEVRKFRNVYDRLSVSTIPDECKGVGLG